MAPTNEQTLATQVDRNGEVRPYPLPRDGYREGWLLQRFLGLDYGRVIRITDPMPWERTGSEQAVPSQLPSIVIPLLPRLRSDAKLWTALTTPFPRTWWGCMYTVVEECLILGLTYDETLLVWFGSCNADITFQRGEGFQWHLDRIRAQYDKGVTRINVITPPEKRPPFWPWVLSEARTAQERDRLTETEEEMHERYDLGDIVVGDCCVSETPDALIRHVTLLHPGMLGTVERLVKRWECS
jgi:hypothetical protein